MLHVWKKKHLRGITCFRLEEERDLDFFSFYIYNYWVSEYLNKIEKKKKKKSILKAILF